MSSRDMYGKAFFMIKRDARSGFASRGRFDRSSVTRTKVLDQKYLKVVSSQLSLQESRQVFIPRAFRSRAKVTKQKGRILRFRLDRFLVHAREP